MWSMSLNRVRHADDLPFLLDKRARRTNQKEALLHSNSSLGFTLHRETCMVVVSGQGSPPHSLEVKVLSVKI